MDLSMILLESEQDTPQIAVEIEPIPLPAQPTLQDCQMQLMHLEQHNCRRLMLARKQDIEMSQDEGPVLMECDGEYQPPPTVNSLCHQDRLPPMKTRSTTITRSHNLPNGMSTYGPRSSLPLPARQSGSGIRVPAQNQEQMHRRRRLGATPIRKTKRHSNFPYTPEEVLYFRYRKEDCGVGYKCIVDELPRFGGPKRETPQCSSSRQYRGDVDPEIDDNGDLIFTSDGNVVTKKCFRRQRKHLDPKMRGPVTLVERNPRWAVLYDWVAPQHKQRAREILEGSDPVYYNSYKDKVRRAIEKWEDITPKMQSAFEALQHGNGAYPSPASSSWSKSSPRRGL